MEDATPITGGGVAGRMLCYGIDADPAHPQVARAECALLAEILLAGPYRLRGSNSAFDIAMVARGRYGAFLNRTSKIWDNVAPQIIVEEAGAVGRRSTDRRSTIPAP
ncbi:inositol monophosphatase family protein [Nonomuraea sp. 10N515B]